MTTTASSPSHRGPARALALLLVCALALGVAACGKRGKPELPEGEKDTLPQVYPAPGTYGPSG